MTVVDVAVPARARVGEGPHWDGAAQLLHWVDILAGQIHSTALDTQNTRTLQLPWLVGAAVPRRIGGFVAATSDGFAEVDLDGTYRARHNLLGPGARMNDAACDSRGRLWAGSTDMEFAPGGGALHVLHPDWTTQVVLDDLTLPNGLGWSPDGAVFYLVDTVERHVLAFDADPDTAVLSRRRVLARFPESAGQPDGLCVDARGNLWIALWGGSQVVRVTPDGKTRERLALPVTQPSSCVFGGPGAATLFVTSAREGLDPGDGSLDGSVLRVSGLDTFGLPGNLFDG